MGGPDHGNETSGDGLRESERAHGKHSSRSPTVAPSGRRARNTRLARIQAKNIIVRAKKILRTKSAACTCFVQTPLVVGMWHTSESRRRMVHIKEEDADDRTRDSQSGRCRR